MNIGSARKRVVFVENKIGKEVVELRGIHRVFMSETDPVFFLASNEVFLLTLLL